MALELWLALAAACAGLTQSTSRLIRTPTIQRTVVRSGATLLIGAGVLTAPLRRVGPWRV